MSDAAADNERAQVLQQYRLKCRKHGETEARLKRIRMDTQVCRFCGPFLLFRIVMTLRVR